FVCYELRFPEIARYQALHAADLLIIPAAWYRGALKERHWQTLLSARALENTVLLLAAICQPAMIALAIAW
uniref:nitrilase-related carbon-nitrogen hydrolase n=1 Tax=Liquorilactobacillus vini TaxID=238015 RepID=UPI002E2175CE